MMNWESSPINSNWYLIIILLIILKDTMTLNQFFALDKNGQANATWAGDFLEQRAEGDYSYNLYNLGEFLVEVKYNRNENRIESFRPYKNSTPLDPYVRYIDLPDLM